MTDLDRDFRNRHGWLERTVLRVPVTGYQLPGGAGVGESNRFTNEVTPIVSRIRSHVNNDRPGTRQLVPGKVFGLNKPIPTTIKNPRQPGHRGFSFSV